MITLKSFGRLADGTSINLDTYQAGKYTVRVTDLGATLVSLCVPDKTGKSRDVVLGFDKAENYLSEKNPYFGATVGRYAGRIAGGRFTLNEKEYQLACNDGPNHLHGGVEGFSFRRFIIHDVPGGMKFSLYSPDGDQGYPGNLQLSVTYLLNENGCLTLNYEAVSDRDTIANFTNHTYFNLNGADSGETVFNHTLCMNSDYYFTADQNALSTDELMWLYESSMDFSVPTLLGKRLKNQKGAIAKLGGIDHYFLFSGDDPRVMLACKSSGIVMKVSTDRPGAQIYTSGMMTHSPVGKGGVVYPRFGGIAIETEDYPNGPNNKAFPFHPLKAGATYTSTTRYSFGLLGKK